MSNDMRGNLEKLSKLNTMKENTASGLKSAAVDCMEKFQPVVENEISNIDEQLHQKSGFFAFIAGIFSAGKKKAEVVEKSSNDVNAKITVDDGRTSVLNRVGKEDADKNVSPLAKLESVSMEHTGKMDSQEK